MSKRRIYKDLDAPVPILFLDPMAFVMGVFGVGVGIVSKNMLLGLALGAGVIYLSKVMSRGAKRGQARHALWRMGVSSAESAFEKAGIHPLMNDFVE